MEPSMRHRFYLISIGAKVLSPKGMPVIPWRKGKQYPLHPGGYSPDPHTARGDHSGNVPAGKLTKGKRNKTGPPGSPNGVCIGGTGCHCGKHYQENRNA